MLKDFTKEIYDVIVLAGQSNGEGHGVGDIDEPYTPTPSVWALNNDFYQKEEFTIAPATEKARGNEVQSNFGLIFARSYIESGRLAEGRKILIVRAAVGGTGFVDGRWGLKDDLYLCMLDMIDTALSLNPENRLVAFLWHQGENEVDKKVSYDVHYERVMSLVEAVRERYGLPMLPFVAGDFVYQWKETKGDAVSPIVDAMRDACRACGYARFVETDGLLSNAQELDRLPWSPGGWKDNVHFSRRSVYELGKRYFQAYVDIENEK